jgi:hypothetical protein
MTRNTQTRHRSGFAHVTLAVAALSLAVATLAGQAPARSAVPRTPWGDPDLQGLWTNATITPFERPANLGGQQVLTEQEAAEFEKQTLAARDADNRAGGTEADLGRAYNQFWYERGTKVVGTKRTSLVVDPPDGRVPALTPEGQQRVDTRAAARRRSPADGPEDRSLAERCILWPTAGPPMVPGGYNNNYQILQSPGYVVILIEMIHDVRIIPLDQTNYRGASPNMTLVERFRRVDAGTIDYQFTIDDPMSFTRAWTAAIPMTKTDGPIYEYACHEGNYGMTNLLSGARAEEKK